MSSLSIPCEVHARVFRGRVQEVKKDKSERQNRLRRRTCVDQIFHLQMIFEKTRWEVYASFVNLGGKMTKLIGKSCEGC